MKTKFFRSLAMLAVLGAVAFTQTACKDYDSDIDSLQEQIDANEAAISENKATLTTIQTLVNSGVVITSVSGSTATGLTLTLSNGSSYTLSDGEDADVWTIEGDYWCLNGVPTEYKAVGEDGVGTEGTPGTDGGYYYPNESGFFDYITYDEEGNEVVTETDIEWLGSSSTTVSGITAVQNADGTVTLWGIDGIEDGYVLGLATLAQLNFIPHYIYAGTQAIELGYITCTLPVAKLAVTTVEDVEYRVNPSNTDLSAVTFSYVGRADVSYVPDSTRATGDVDAFEAVTGVTSYNYGDDAIQTDIELDLTKTTSVAEIPSIYYMLGTTDDVAISSDYTAILPAQYMAVISSTTAVLDEDGDSLVPYLYRTEKPVVTTLGDEDIIIYYDRENLTFYGTIDLLNYVNEAAYCVSSPLKGIATGITNWKAMEAFGFNMENLYWDFTIVDDYIASDDTDQGSFIDFVDGSSSIIEPARFTSVIDRTPLIYAQLMSKVGDSSCPIAACYIELTIKDVADIPVVQEVVEITVPSVTFNYADLFGNCDDVYESIYDQIAASENFIDVTWDWVNDEVYDHADVLVSHNEFINNYLYDDNRTIDWDLTAGVSLKSGNKYGLVSSDYIVTTGGVVPTGKLPSNCFHTEEHDIDIYTNFISYSFTPYLSCGTYTKADGTAPYITIRPNDPEYPAITFYFEFEIVHPSIYTAMLDNYLEDEDAEEPDQTVITQGMRDYDDNYVMELYAGEVFNYGNAFTGDMNDENEMGFAGYASQFASNGAFDFECEMISGTDFSLYVIDAYEPTADGSEELVNRYMSYMAEDGSMNYFLTNSARQGVTSGDLYDLIGTTYGSDYEGQTLGIESNSYDADGYDNNVLKTEYRKYAMELVATFVNGCEDVHSYNIKFVNPLTVASTGVEFIDYMNGYFDTRNVAEFFDVYFKRPACDNAAYLFLDGGYADVDGSMFQTSDFVSSSDAMSIYELAAVSADYHTIFKGEYDFGDDVEETSNMTRSNLTDNTYRGWIWNLIEYRGWSEYGYYSRVVVSDQLDYTKPAIMTDETYDIFTWDNSGSQLEKTTKVGEIKYTFKTPFAWADATVDANVIPEKDMDYAE